jgi:VWFA-related protein
MGRKVTSTLRVIAAFLLLGTLVVSQAPAQSDNDNDSASVKPGKKDQPVPQEVAPMTIPVTPRMKKNRAEEELISLGDLTIKEDGDLQNILYVRNIGNNPITLAVLIQDDLVSSISNEIKYIADFIRHLPKDSKVMVGYMRTGSLQVRQRFTNDLEKAAKALRIPAGTPSVAPYNPYVEVIEGIKKFDNTATGRRAALVISDGLDTSHGTDFNSSLQSLDLQRAINEAQRKGIAIYGFYAPTQATSSGRSLLAADAQGSLERLANETGGHAYFQGTGAPTSFDPYLRELGSALTRQIAVTYLSTHPNKGFHRVEVHTDRTDIEIDYPTSYRRN